MYQICTLAHHLSLGTSMVRASHRSSEGCGFNPCLGLRNHFLSIELEDCSSTSMSSIYFLVLIKDVINVVAWLLYDVLYTMLSSYSTQKNFLSP